jgi:hypothetical protein
MAEIIRLRGSPHERVQQLLPWYVNGTLEADEAAVVETHLAECAECRAELALERTMAHDVAALPLDIEQTWSRMSERVEAAPAPRRLTDPVPFLRRRVPIGWALGGPLAAAAAVAFAITTVTPSRPVGQTYRALGSAPTAAPGNALVMFKADTRDSDLRAALTAAGARVVDGPTATGAYVLHIEPGLRGKALERLRAAPQVTLAEPIDPGSPQ